MTFSIRIKRVYDEPSPSDGYRILVDRLWPRGLSKERAAIDEWMKELAPTHSLRRWFGHDSEKWREFQKRYQAELQNDECIGMLNNIRQISLKSNVTLLFAAKNTAENNAVIIKQILDTED